MRSIIIVSVITLAFTGCNSNAPQPIQQNSNAASTAAKERPATAVAHTSENRPAPMAPASNSGGSKWSQSGDPIDTKKFDDAIAKAEKTVSSKPSDEAAKKELSKAYFERAVALTDARQYASALGDYRRAIKHDPSNAEAKEWIDRIVMIYDSIGKSSPKEGEEPPPLPFKK